MSKLNKGMFSSNNQKWETPQELFDKLNDVLILKWILQPLMKQQNVLYIIQKRMMD